MPTPEPKPPDTRERRYPALWNDCAPGEKLLTKGEVAQLCRVEVRTVDRWLIAGKIRCYRTPSGRVLFRRNDVLVATEREPVLREGRASRPSGAGGRASLLLVDAVAFAGLSWFG